MSHGKSMDFETILENCLMKYQPIRPKDLLAKLHEQGKSPSRSQFYRYAKKLEKNGKLQRKNGVWYYPKKQSPKKNAEEEIKRKIKSKIDEARKAWEDGDLSIANRKLLTASKMLAKKKPKSAILFFAVQSYLQDEEERVLKQFPNASRWQKSEIVSFFILRMIESLESIANLKLRETAKGKCWRGKFTGEELGIYDFVPLLEALLRSIGLYPASDKQIGHKEQQ